MDEGVGMKRVYVSTLGCAKNLVDSEMMIGSLLDSGYRSTEALEEADIAIVNTCGFIEAAKEESIHEILEIAESKKAGKLNRLVVTGCLAQRYSEELQMEIPEIDLILGTTSFIHIVSKLEELESKRGDKLLSIEDINKEIPTMRRQLLTQSHTAYLKIAEGCDNLCTYCIIPKLRGKYRSRSMEDILAEARELVKYGARELIIIAQDTTKFGLDTEGRKLLAPLLQELNKIEKLKWVRVLYSYPEDIDEEIVLTISRSEKILPYFDIPIQHASDRILKRMNRHTSNRQIAEKVAMIRKHLPESTIRTTIIVGFPQETEEDFEELCSFIQAIRFDRLGAFEFSSEEGTPAAKMSGQVPDAVKRLRRDRLMEIQQQISKETNRGYVGKELEVLIEAKEDKGVFSGRSYRDMIEIDGLVFVHSNKELKCGEFVKVKITDSLEYDLIGEYHEFTE